MKCVYCIYNTKNNRYYIGSTNSYKKRISTHKRELKKGSHHNGRLQNAFNKYGLDYFIFSIVKVTDDVKFWEQYYIDNFNCWYNISKSTKCPMGGRKHSKRTLELMKKRKVPSGSNHYMKKVGPSTSHRQNMGLARKKHKWSESVRKKMSETAKRLNSIERIDRTKQYKKIKDNFGNTFESLRQASIFHDINISTICDNLKGRSKLVRKKYKFNYVGSNENL